MIEGPLGGAVALITCASSGFGAATASRLAGEGAAVALVGRQRDRLERVAAEIAASGGASLVVEADITDPELAELAVTMTVDRFARLDVLVNNAGIRLLGTALHTTVEQWDKMIELNITALVHVTHAAVPYLIDAAATSPRRIADIVNVGSTGGRIAQPGNSVYNLTRFGLSGFTESLRQELLSEQVRVSVVEPGTVDTEPIDDLGDGVGGVTRSRVGDLEVLRPADVADAIAYIVTRDQRIAVNEVMLRAFVTGGGAPLEAPFVR